MIAELSKPPIEITVCDFTSIVPLISDEKKQRIQFLSNKKANIVFTSKNAVEAVINSLKTKPVSWSVFCVEGPTRQRVTEYLGITAISATGKNALEIAKQIVEKNIDEIVFFCGIKRRKDLPHFLEIKKVAVEEIHVYDTIPLRQKLNEAFDGVIFFSPGAVDCFFCDNQPLEKTIFFAIGETTSATIKKYTANRVFTSPVANKNILVKKVTEFFLYPNQMSDWNENNIAK